MYRRHFHALNAQGETDFRWRGEAVSRLEGLTDAVFALALTLIVVSLSVPTTYAELIEAFRQVPVFLGCFAILFWCWVCHFQFHRRYGMEDPITILLNAVLLFLVLLYAYPLKFLFGTLWNRILRDFRVYDTLGQPVVDAAGNFVRPYASDQGPSLMILYGLGYAGIFLTYTAMTWHAWRRREVLELDERERLVTLGTLRGHGIQAGFGLMSVGLAWLDLAPIAGLIYFGIGPAMGLHGWWSGRKVEALRP